MDFKPIINNKAHKNVAKVLTALFALISFIGALVVIVSREKLVSGLADSSSSIMRDPTGAMGLVGSLDAFLDGGALVKLMSILVFVFSCVSFMCAFKTKDKVIFSAIGGGAALIQFVMGLIVSPISVKGLVNAAMKSALSGGDSFSLGTPLPVLIVLMIMSVIVCVANILGIVMKIDDAQLVNGFKSKSQQPQYQQPMMGQPYQQPMAPQQMQPQYQQPMMGQPMQQYQQPMAPQQMQQPVPQAQPQYQQPVAPQPVQQPVPQAQPQYQQPVASQPAQQPVPQAQPQYQQPVAPQPVQQPVLQEQPQYQQPVAPQPAQQPVPQAQPQYQQPVAPQPVQQPVPQPQEQSVSQPQQTDNFTTQ